MFHNVQIEPVQAELHRKTVANAFWNGEVENEIRELGWDHVTFKKAQDRERIMEEIDNERAVNVYEHNHCTEDCKRRGKLNLVDAWFFRKRGSEKSSLILTHLHFLLDFCMINEISISKLLRFEHFMK